MPQDACATTGVRRLDFWEHARASRAVDGDLVHGVSSVLGPLREPLARLTVGALAWAESAEVVDRVRDSLDGAWRSSGRREDAFYPEARMSHVLGVFGAAVCRGARASGRGVGSDGCPRERFWGDLSVVTMSRETSRVRHDNEHWGAHAETALIEPRVGANDSAEYVSCD